MPIILDPDLLLILVFKNYNDQLSLNSYIFIVIRINTIKNEQENNNNTWRERGRDYMIMNEMSDVDWKNNVVNLFYSCD